MAKLNKTNIAKPLAIALSYLAVISVFGVGFSIWNISVINSGEDNGYLSAEGGVLLGLL